MDRGPLLRRTNPDSPTDIGYRFKAADSLVKRWIDSIEMDNDALNQCAFVVWVSVLVVLRAAVMMLGFSLLCRQNLEQVRRLDDRAAQGRACGNLGNTHYLLGNFGQAITFHEEVRLLCCAFAVQGLQLVSLLADFAATDGETSERVSERRLLRVVFK